MPMNIIRYNFSLLLLVLCHLGCPECATKCNIDLKKKMMILFPTMAEKQISEVLPKEDGTYYNNIIV